MRSHADPPTRSAPDLNDRARHGLAGGALLLLVLALATGGISSPLLIAVGAALVLIVRFAANPAESLAPVIAGLIVSAFETVFGAGGTAGVATGLLLAAAGIPGWLWRREKGRADERLAQLDDILAQARRGARGEAPAAAQVLADLELALAAVADRIGAHTVMLWDVEVYRGRAEVRAASRGRPGHAVRLSGDPLGWVWEQGMRLRLDPTPRWADADLLVVADRLRHDEEEGQIVTYAFDGENLPVDDATFEQSAVYLRGLLSVQEARSRAAAREQRTNAILKTLERVPGDLDVETLMMRLCETAMEVAGATGAAIGVWTGDAGHVIAAAGPDGGPRPGDPFAPPTSELGLAVRADHMIVRDASAWTLGRTVLAWEGERWNHRPRCLAVLPLRNAAMGIEGVLAVWSARSPALKPDGLEMLPLLAPQITLNIEQARAFDQMRESAERDPLTQLRNRRAFDDVFAAETVRFARYGRPLSALVIDLDHFKSINDQFGHEAGDDVLCRTARIIEGSIRDIDTAARFGGEEFVVLLPETDIASAIDVAERIRATVAGTSIEHNGHTIPVRASIGVSACPDRVTLPAELIGSADAALYRAKGEGRNRVIAASR